MALAHLVICDTEPGSTRIKKALEPLDPKHQDEKVVLKDDHLGVNTRIEKDVWKDDHLGVNWPLRQMAVRSAVLLLTYEKGFVLQTKSIDGTPQYVGVNNL